MKKLTSTLLFVVITSLSSYSQTKQENLKELLTIMQIDKMMDKMYSSMIPAMQSQMKKAVPDSIRNEKYEAFMNESMKMITEENKKMVSNFLNYDMIGIYDRNFTEQDVKDLLAFYKSPIGLKMVEKQPIMQKETMEVMMTKYIPKYQETIKEIMKKIIEKRD